MKNRMQDLDFEQNVAFDKVQEYEFTRRAAQRFRQVVSLDSFEDEDADVIFHYLYKEMELVSFGDHLKRYIYERAELEEPFSEVPQEVYKEIVVDSFKETYTPKSMNPTSTKLSALVNNWLNQASVKRETVFLLGFGLKMTTEDVSDFLTRVLKEQDFDFHNPDEVIYWYCYSTQQGYHKAEELKKKYEILAPVEVENTQVLYGSNLCLDTEEKLIDYLARLKSKRVDPISEKSQAFQEFTKLLYHAKQIIAGLYQHDEEEKGGDKVWTAERITPSDVEKVICSGIPINKMGNLKKMSASILAKHFSQKRFSRQRITKLLYHAKQIIARLYQHDEEEKGGDKVWTAERITPSDVEKVICSGIPINKMGNLKKMSASILAKHFSQKRFSRQRITNILSHKLPVERFDLITLEFFIVSQEMEDDDPFNRYKHFLDEIQDILLRCGMGEIYIVNPYECFLLMCLLTDCPLAVFSEIWEKSYEEGEAEEA